MAFLAPLLRRYARLNRLTQNELARELGLTEGALYRLMGREAPQTDAEVAQLAGLFGIDRDALAQILHQ